MWRSWIVLALCLSLVIAQEEEEEKLTKLPFKPPDRPSGDVYFVEPFVNPDEIWMKWVMSAATKEGADSDVAKYNGKWSLEELSVEGGLDGDLGLVMEESAKHYAIAAKLERPFKFQNQETFVAQYEVNFQTGLTCGGAYIKLLTYSDDLDLANFQDKTPYSIMFGPDKCGMSSKVHLIIRFENPTTGEVEEKHSKQSTDSMDFFSDKKTHLFTLIIHSDSTYHIVIDQTPFLKGNLLEDLSPPINPPKEIDDPDDKMPSNWDEREKIPDPEATKPDDWDEDAPAKIPDPDAVKPENWLDDGPEYIPDPDATTPEDWDEEEDGEWEPPMIPNPACEEVGCGKWEPAMIQNPNYKGRWKPPLIDNPEYMGKWAPRKIENPAYFEDNTPFFNLFPIGAVGFELWTMNEDIYFDNVIITSELAVANNYAREGWTLKHESERKAGGAMSLGPWIDMFVENANERPYLWALYAIVIVLPFVLCAACCVRSKPKPKDDVATRKKTDAPSPDDPHAKEEEEDEEEKGPAEGESFVASAEDEDAEGKGPLSPAEQEDKGIHEEEEEEEGEGSQEGGASQEEGGASQEEGEARQEEGGASQEEEGGASQEEEEGASQEEADTKDEERKTSKGRPRKRKTRRED